MLIDNNIINNQSRFILENPFLTINTETSCGEIANLDKLNVFSTAFENEYDINYDYTRVYIPDYENAFLKILTSQNIQSC